MRAEQFSNQQFHGKLQVRRCSSGKLSQVHREILSNPLEDNKNSEEARFCTKKCKGFIELKNRNFRTIARPDSTTSEAAFDFNGFDGDEIRCNTLFKLTQKQVS
jgi:hypothetical protein